MLLRKYSKSRANIMKRQKSIVPTNLKYLARKNSSQSFILPSLTNSGKIENMFPKIPQPIVDPGFQVEVPILSTSRPNSDLLTQNLQKINSCSTDSIRSIIIEKLKLCSIICYFTENEEDKKAVEAKTLILKEIHEFIDPRNEEYLLDPELCMYFNRMCYSNLSGSQIIPKSKLLVPVEEETMFVNPAIKHVTQIFDILTRYISIFDEKVLLGKDLISLIIDLVGAPDMRERRMAATVIFKLISNSKENTHFILHKVFYNIYQYQIGVSDFFGISGYLSILTNNYAAFCPKGHRRFKEMLHYIISLANFPHLQNYSKNLLFFLEEVMKNNNKIAPYVITKLIKRFPVSHLANQVIFIGFINKILHGFCARVFSKVYLETFTFYAKCARSDSRRVIEESLVIWDDDEICKCIAVFAKNIYPIIYTPLKELSLRKSIDDLSVPASCVLKKMKTLNASEFIRVEAGRIKIEKLTWEKKWQIIKETAEINELNAQEWGDLPNGYKYR